jgi:hypothetical protein
MKIYTVFTAADKSKFHAWALSKGIETHYRSMSNGNLMAIAYGSLHHETELTDMGFTLLPPLEEPDTKLSAEQVSMFPEDMGISTDHNTYQATKLYSEQTGTKTFHPRR